MKLSSCTIECDRCHARTLDEWTMRKARRRARAEGWKLSDRHGDLCDICRRYWRRAKRARLVA